MGWYTCCWCQCTWCSMSDWTIFFLLVMAQFFGFRSDAIGMLSKDVFEKLEMEKPRRERKIFWGTLWNIHEKQNYFETPSKAHDVANAFRIWSGKATAGYMPCKVTMNSTTCKHQEPVVPLVEDLSMRISVSRSVWATCIKILSDHLCKISVSGSCSTTWVLFRPTLWGLCMRILLDRTTCARSLLQAPFDYLHLSVQDFLRTTCIILEEHLRKISISDPARPLVQDLCFRIHILLDHLCARSLSQNLCMTILLDHLHQDPVGPLVQNLCIRMLLDLVSGSSRTTCARSLYQDPSGPLCQDRVGQLAQDPGSCSLYRSTCTRSLDHCLSLCLRISVLRSFWTTCIRIV